MTAIFIVTFLQECRDNYLPLAWERRTSVSCVSFQLPGIQLIPSETQSGGHQKQRRCAALRVCF